MKWIIFILHLIESEQVSEQYIVTCQWDEESSFFISSLVNKILYVSKALSFQYTWVIIVILYLSWIRYISFWFRIILSGSLSGIVSGLAVTHFAPCRTIDNRLGRVRPGSPWRVPCGTFCRPSICINTSLHLRQPYPASLPSASPPIVRRPPADACGPDSLPSDELAPEPRCPKTILDDTHKNCVWTIRAQWAVAGCCGSREVAGAAVFTRWARSVRRCLTGIAGSWRAHTALIGHALTKVLTIKIDPDHYVFYVRLPHEVHSQITSERNTKMLIPV